MNEYTEAAEEVQTIVNEMVEGEWGETMSYKAFIASVYDELNVKISLDEFKMVLTELNQKGLITLGRCDMAYAFDRTLIERSEIKDSISEFHLIYAS